MTDAVDFGFTVWIKGLVSWRLGGVAPPHGAFSILTPVLAYSCIATSMHHAAGRRHAAIYKRSTRIFQVV
eukprot:3644838-Prymnesium_polylepis.1